MTAFAWMQLTTRGKFQRSGITQAWGMQRECVEGPEIRWPRDLVLRSGLRCYWICAGASWPCENHPRNDTVCCFFLCHKLTCYYFSASFCVCVWFRKYCSLQLHLPLFWSRLPFKKTFVCHDKLLFTLPVFVMLRWSRTYVLTCVNLELCCRKSSDISTTLGIWQIFSVLWIPVTVTSSVFLPCSGTCPLARVLENSSCRKVITTSMYDYNL